MGREIAETADTIYLLKPKAKTALQDSDIIAKRSSAEEWRCAASAHAQQHGGKPWCYVLIPHTVI
ncbi:MAG: hypothetical protein H6642_10620 [Caldilineaceae bacterium]|nr:hypothetical protein [Caldilineaceae bacterium]